MIPGLPQVGGAELMILLFFGAKRIPSLARSLGSGVREFRESVSGQYEEAEQKGKRLPQSPETASSPNRRSLRRRWPCSALVSRSCCS
jgi:sec-independent protein translocase protein TatA